MAQNDLAGPIGRPLDRVDGPLKVTGRAKYPFEYASQGEATYGFIVSAPIAKGRVVGVDVRDAERAPGVLLVLTQDNAPPQTPWGPVDLPDRLRVRSLRSIPIKRTFLASPSLSWLPKPSSKLAAPPLWSGFATLRRAVSMTCTRQRRRRRNPIPSMATDPPILPSAILSPRSLPRP
jgi:hypothetical protein